jgi:hypothetical protein
MRLIDVRRNPNRYSIGSGRNDHVS